jgi:hypothetical protein
MKRNTTNYILSTRNSIKICDVYLFFGQRIYDCALWCLYSWLCLQQQICIWNTFMYTTRQMRSANHNGLIFKTYAIQTGTQYTSPVLLPFSCHGSAYYRTYINYFIIIFISTSASLGLIHGPSSSGIKINGQKLNCIYTMTCNRMSQIKTVTDQAFWSVSFLD